VIRTLDVMLSQLGVAEATGNNDGVPSERYADGDEVMWCAAIILWANTNSQDAKIARDVKERYRFRSVTALEAAMKERGWWLPPTTYLNAIMPNDLVLQAWATSDAGAPGGKRITGRHVDIVEKVEGTALHCVGGNVDNMVKRVIRRWGSSTITGFVRIPVTEG
jgi:hypothetical protein